MDLGIAGKTALVCAASKGLGRGCALALARNGVAVTITARTAKHAGGRRGRDRRARAAARSRRSPATSPRPKAARPRSPPVRSPTSWSTTPADRRPAISANGTRRTGCSACNANMITAIMLIKATVDGMIARRFGRIVNITSSSVKAPIAQLGLSNGARAGPDRLRRRPRPPDGRAQRHHQQHPARPLRHRPAALRPGVRGAEVGPAGRRGRGRSRAPRSRPSGSARPRSSASSAPSSAAPRRATSPARTS